MYMFGNRQIFFEEPDSGGEPPEQPVEPAKKAKPDHAAQIAALKAEVAEKKKTISDLEKSVSAAAPILQRASQMETLIASVLESEHSGAPEFVKSELVLDDLKKDPVEGLLVLRQTRSVYDRLRAELEKETTPPDPTKPRPGETPDIDTSTRAGALKFLANLRKDK